MPDSPYSITCEVDVIPSETFDGIWNWRVNAIVTGPGNLAGFELTIVSTLNDGFEMLDSALTDPFGRISEIYGVADACNGQTSVVVDIDAQDIGVGTRCSADASDLADSCNQAP